MSERSEGMAVALDPLVVRDPDPWKRNPKQGMCKCGQMQVPAGVDGVNWYWQRHARDGCTLELPNTRCWCGLLRSEHINGHAEGVAYNA